MGLVKIGCIGIGKVMQRVHIPSLQKINDARVVALSDVNERKLEKVAQTHSIRRIFIDYRQMVKQVDLDAVYIAVPPMELKRISLDCLSRGLHVFMEKPPGITLSETEKMADAAARNECKTMVGFNRRYSKILIQAKKIMEERGPITQYLAEFHKSFLPESQKDYLSNWPDQTRRRIWLLDIVIHCLDTLRWMGGEVCNVSSIVKRFHSEYPDSFAIILEFESGSVGMVNANFHAGARAEQYKMHGRGITVSVDPSNFIKIYKDNNPQAKIVSYEEIVGDEEPYIADGYFGESVEFITCIKKNKMPNTSIGEALKTMELAELVWKGVRGASELPAMTRKNVVY